ncbi:hypothetical protein BGZ98_006759 [Dissophora globulifera]|nr:hypothetical protein BGZ98_006759 [Dissophora globulifera]
MATKSKTKQEPKGPAPYRHQELILVRTAHPTIIARTWTNNMEQWAKGVPLPQYHARERHLASTAFSSNGRLVSWVLVPKPGADVTDEYKAWTASATTAAEGVRGAFDPQDGSEANQERIMSAVETYERPGMVAVTAAAAEADTDSRDVVKDVSTIAVASVYAPSKYRNHGYGKLMMKLLWDEIEKMDNIAFTFLYSDLGSQFYGNIGWTARTSTEIVIPVGMILPSISATSDSDDGHNTGPSNKRTTRAAASASADAIVLDAVASHDTLQTLLDRDTQLLREALNQRALSQNQTGSTATTTFVAVTPEIHCFQWLQARAWYNATHIWKFDPAQIQDGLHYGVRRVTNSNTSDQFILWHHDFTDDQLYILRWRVDSTQSKAEADAISLVLIDAAQKEAKKWKLSKIVYWNPDPALAELLSLEPKDRNHNSIPSLGLVNSLTETQNVEWIMNEKYSWC